MDHTTGEQGADRRRVVGPTFAEETGKRILRLQQYLESHYSCFPPFSLIVTEPVALFPCSQPFQE